MKVLVGSKNPVKIEAVRTAFNFYFAEAEIIGIEVNSKVPKQPVNNETFKGAENRAEELYKINKADNLNAEYFAGIEGGIMKIYDRWFSFGCMCIINKEGKKSFGTSAHFQLPDDVVEELLKGEELGDVMDKIQRKQNTKQKEGAIGYLTKGFIDRKELYMHGIISALIPFVRKEIF